MLSVKRPSAARGRAGTQLSGNPICAAQSWALLECVQERLNNLIPGHNPSGQHSIDATPDVNKLVEEFKSVIGRTWSLATHPNNVSHVTVGAQRHKRPWIEVRDVMARTGGDSPAAYIASHVEPMTPFCQWLP